MNNHTVRSIRLALLSVEEAQSCLAEVPIEETGTSDLAALDHLVQAHFYCSMLLNAAEAKWKDRHRAAAGEEGEKEERAGWRGFLRRFKDWLPT